MNNSMRISGVEKLLEYLPSEYHYWHCFGTILNFNYNKIFDYERKFEYISCIEMLLTDKNYNFKIKLKLTDVDGDINFNTINGFFSGLTIKDTLSECCEYSLEADRPFLITSFEQDINFKLRCEAISVELVDSE